MTDDARMFNSININDSNSYDSIIFGNNVKGKVKGLVRLQYPMTWAFQRVCHIHDLPYDSEYRVYPQVNNV
jgi:hypothetical protein